MKTVMKKIFSLMLVAVLLVGVMPFQAFAAEETKAFDLTLTPGTYNVDTIVAEKYTGSSTNYWVHRTAPSAEDYVKGASFDAVEGGAYTLYVVETVEDPAPTPATVTCSTCGETYTEGSAHTCPTVTCDKCGDSYTKGTSHTCPTLTCDKCGDSYTKGTTHTCPTVTCSTCKATYTKGTAHTCVKVSVTFVDQVNGTTVTDTYYPSETVKLSTPAYVNGYEFLGWKVSGTSTYLGSTFTVPSSDTTIVAQWEKTAEDITYPLKVYARLHTGDEVTDVVEVHRNSNMLSNDKIMSYLAHPDTMSALWNVVNNKYSDYTWSGHFYNAYGDRVATDNITTVNGSKSVYINLYSEADRVLVYVHTVTSTTDYDRIIEMDGYKVGGPKGVVRGYEVLNALKPYYGSNITMKMFDAKGFTDYLNHKPNTQTDYITLTGNTTEIHVRLYVTSSSSTADSSNPKTGDMITAPIFVMGASVTALAVLFFLNKKRAF